MVIQSGNSGPSIMCSIEASHVCILNRHRMQPCSMSSYLCLDRGSVSLTTSKVTGVSVKDVDARSCVSFHPTLQPQCLSSPVAVGISNGSGGFVNTTLGKA